MELRGEAVRLQAALALGVSWCYLRLNLLLTVQDRRVCVGTISVTSWNSWTFAAFLSITNSFHLGSPSFSSAPGQQGHHVHTEVHGRADESVPPIYQKATQRAPVAFEACNPKCYTRCPNVSPN